MPAGFKTAQKHWNAEKKKSRKKARRQRNQHLDDGYAVNKPYRHYIGMWTRLGKQQSYHEKRKKLKIERHNQIKEKYNATKERMPELL